MRKVRLKKIGPCPFCGGAADIYASYENPNDYHVKCDECFARSGWFHNVPDAIDAWNRRAQNDTL